MIYLKILEAIKNWLPFIEKHWKTFIFIAVSILAIIFYLRGEKLKKRLEDAEQGRDAAIRISNGLSSEVHRYKNKLGDTVVRIKATTVPKSQLPEILKEEKAKWLFDKFNGPTSANIQSGQSFETSFISGEVKHDTVKIPCKDTLKVERYYRKDAWNDIDALVVGKPKLEIRDRYYGVVYLKRPKGWFFRLLWSKRETVAEITNSNKLIKIDSLVDIEVKR